MNIKVNIRKLHYIAGKHSQVFRLQYYLTHNHRWMWGIIVFGRDQPGIQVYELKYPGDLMSDLKEIFCKFD